MTPVVSVHTPKCSGTAFTAWLRSAYDENRIYFDYGDHPLDPAAPMNVDRPAFLERWGGQTALPDGKQVAHGHFWAKKYENIRSALRITFLRHPLDRLISHYFFWRARTQTQDHSLHARVLAEDMDILTFATLPQMRGAYRDHFFAGVDIARFDFVGQSDAYADELGRLERLLNRKGKMVSANRNPDAAYAEKRAAILADRALHGRLTDMLRNDIAFYERYAGRI